MTQLKVYEFNQIKNDASELYRVYQTNDVQLHQAHKELLLNKIKNVFDQHKLDSKVFIEALDDVRLTRKKLDFHFNKIKPYVDGFEIPSDVQINKLFKKVKKLKTPDFDLVDRKSTVFLAWNDIATDRKYFIYRDTNDELKGTYGTLSRKKVKGFCKICNHESDVSLFLSKSKTGNDGTYSKKGDYICNDSAICNSNLTNIDDFYAFIESLK